MTFNVNEIKKWAKEKGFTIKKKDEGYTWQIGEDLPSEPMDISEVVKEIFNKFTDGKWKEHQKNWAMK